MKACWKTNKKKHSEMTKFVDALNYYKQKETLYVSYLRCFVSNASKSQLTGKTSMERALQHKTTYWTYQARKNEAVRCFVGIGAFMLEWVLCS